jgi:hypothetical protein
LKTPVEADKFPAMVKQPGKAKKGAGAKAQAASPGAPLSGNGKTWPADRVQRLNVDQLVPYARNARTHSDEQVAMIAGNIKRFGWTVPIIVDVRGEIIAGHGRVLAAKQLGLTEVPGVTIHDDEWSEADKSAYRIWDNQSALLSDWSPEMLRQEVTELKDFGYDLSLLGFGEQHLQWLTHGDLVDDATGEWVGMPGWENPDERPFRSIVVHFLTDQDVKAFAKLIGQNITDKTKFTWFPQLAEKTFVDKKYEQAAE